jgi:hypothetical protein
MVKFDYPRVQKLSTLFAHDYSFASDPTAFKGIQCFLLLHVRFWKSCAETPLLTRLSQQTASYFAAFVRSLPTNLSLRSSPTNLHNRGI